jgi:uncharacterized glyoxalase superfamily protein PhnB
MTKEFILSVMLAVPDAPAASAWYRKAFGAEEIWNLGSVIGLRVHGTVFFLGQPENNGWEFPAKLGTTTTRKEVFVNDPDPVIDRAIGAGATGDADGTKNHQMPWGTHRQGGFTDPFVHRWLVGDTSPLRRHPGQQNPRIGCLPFRRSADQSSASLIASLICRAPRFILTFAWSALPSDSSLRLPVTFPTTSLIFPFAVAAVFLILSLSPMTKPLLRQRIRGVASPGGFERPAPLPSTVAAQGIHFDEVGDSH